MTELHEHVEDVPPLKGSQFYKCISCMHSKSKQCPHNTTPHQDRKDQKHTPTTNKWWEIDFNMDTVKTQDTPSNIPHQDYGQHFHIDYGFMKGSGYCAKDEKGRTITSLDGYRSYCLIIEKKSRYTWTFLTKTKAPPIALLDTFLKEHGNPNAKHKTIQTDQRGELWSSQDFREIALKHQNILEPTAAGAPFPNGMADWPNQTYAAMVRCLLHFTNLLPHSTINMTPGIYWT
jgi:hypothetical protein